MKSRVYFTSVKDSDNIPDTEKKLRQLLGSSRVLDFIRKTDTAVVKTHFGEEGNDGYVRPAYMAVICAEAAKRCARAFLSDANTLYRGKRLTCADHIKCAADHGFTKERMGVDIVIPDDAKKENVREVGIGQKHIASAKIVRVYTDADAFIAVSHFKGHILTGFGGAIKNVGMGCATREGKLAQHCDLAPVVRADKCVGCGACEKVCLPKAITIEDGKSKIDVSKCIGCAACVAACPTLAMFIDFGAGEKVEEKMAEYAFAVLKDRKDRCAFINFAVRIRKECDCWSEDTPQIAPDAGIFASADPVAVDMAAFDMIKKLNARNVFREAHPNTDGIRQLKHASDIGLGSLDYELVEV